MFSSCAVSRCRSKEHLALRLLFPTIPLPIPTLEAATRAPRPVWAGSVAKPVRFAPLAKKAAVRLWHRARDFDRGTHQPGHHGGAVGGGRVELRGFGAFTVKRRNARIGHNPRTGEAKTAPYLRPGRELRVRLNRDGMKPSRAATTAPVPADEA
jgi:hypothetical protein